MANDQKIYSVSGKVQSVATADGLKTIVLDSSAHEPTLQGSQSGPQNYLYKQGDLTAAQEAILADAKSKGVGVTLYYKTGSDAGRVVNAIRVMAEQAITVNQNIFMCGAQRWSPKGLCYQPTDDVDPLSDDNLSTLTSLLDPNTEAGLWKLGVNCLRVYQVDPTKKHGQVMQLLAKHGIYVLVGCVNSATAIPRNATSVPAQTVNRVKQVADTFAGYANVMGFSIANELLDSGEPSEYGLVSIVKQVKQQMQTHMASKGYRAIPIGCCTRDVPGYTFPATSAYACGDKGTRMDFVGYNCYRWVVAHGNKPDASALNAYYELYSHFQKFPIPVMLTEIGAQCAGGRDWTQIPYIFGQSEVSSSPPNSQSANMADSISGCFVFRYYEQGNHFGLVQPVSSATPTQVTDGGGGGYAALSAAYANVTAFNGNPNGVDKLDCKSLSGNPYAGNSPSGGLPEATTVTLTNGITNPTSGCTIVFNYSSKANPSSNDWVQAVTIPALGPSQQFTFPAGTQAISMVYQTAAGAWYQGCQLAGANLLALKNGQTIQGNWVAPDGNGTCPII